MRIRLYAAMLSAWLVLFGVLSMADAQETSPVSDGLRVGAATLESVTILPAPETAGTELFTPTALDNILLRFNWMCSESFDYCVEGDHDHVLSDVVPSSGTIYYTGVSSTFGSCSIVSSTVATCVTGRYDSGFRWRADFSAKVSPFVTQFLFTGINQLDAEFPNTVVLNENFIRNGSFDSGFANWGFFGDVLGSVNNGILNFYRESPGWRGATAFQNINRGIFAGTQLEVAMQLGNTSNRPKAVEITLREPTFQQAISCALTIPPNTPLTTFRMYDTVDIYWAGAVFTVRSLDQDNTPFIQVDNVSVREYTASTLDRLSCVGLDTPDYTPLVNNGSFTNGLRYWTMFGAYDFNITNGIMTFYRTSTQQSAVLFQTVPRHFNPNSPLQLFVRLGNTSNTPREVEVYLRATDWSQNFRCTYTIAANTPLTYVRIQGVTNTEWGSAMILVRDTSSVNQPSILVDDASLTYLAGQSFNGQCSNPNLSSSSTVDFAVPEGMKVPVTILPDAGLLPDADGAAPLPVTPPNPQPEGIPAIPGF